MYRISYLDLRPAWLACIFAATLLLSLGSALPCQAAPWRSTGPEGGFVTVLHYPYGAGPRLLAGTYGGGVFFSDDNGLSWTDITGTMSDYVLVEFVSVQGPQPRTWAATAEGIVYRTGSFNGLWDFASGGLGSFFSPPALTGIAVDQTDVRKLAASALEGLWLTETGGTAWPDSIYINLGGSHTDVEITDRAPVRYYVTGRDELWRSDDARNFDSLRNGLPNGYAMDLEIWPGSVDSVLVAYLDKGLYLSEDGTNFRFVGPGSNGANSPRMRKIEVLPQSGEIFLCSERALHFSADLGETWQSIEEPTPLQFPEYWSLAVLDAPQHEFLVGTFGRGILRTQSSGPWLEQNAGLVATWVTDLAVREELVLAATRNGRVYLSRDGGESWDDVTGNLDSLGILAVTISPDGSRWLVGTLEGLLFSDDGGVTWTRSSRGYPGQQAVFELQELPMAGEGVVYAGTLAGVYVSRDFGEEWKRVESLPAEPAFRVSAVDPQGRIWWGGDAVGFYRSQDGQVFEAVDLGLGGLPPTVRGLAFDANREDLIFWASTRDFYRWTPEQGSIPISSALPTKLVNDLLVLPGGILVAALADEGVFASESHGDDWLDWSEGLVPTRPLALAYQGGGTPALLTGTFAKGVFVKDLIPLAPDGSQENRIVRRVGNYPNPFNPRTLVSFHLDRPGRARVEIFDQRGRRVALLHDGPMPAGENELLWDARDRGGDTLPSGVYQVRVDVEGELRSLPITLLR